MEPQPHRNFFNRRFASALAISVGVVLVVMGIAFYPQVRQRLNMQAARRHIDLKCGSLIGDVRFHQVSLGVSTGGGGVLCATGDVASRRDAEAFRDALFATNPPVRTIVHLNISPSAENAEWDVLDVQRD